MKRTCGDCISCCAYWRVREINKPPMIDCQFVKLVAPPKKNSVFLTGKSNSGNCTIYDERPKSCKEYKCAWLDGYGEDGDRPDKSLMLFDNKNNIENAYQARPLSPDQEQTQDGKDVICRMSKSLNKPIVVMNFYERKVVRIEGNSIEED